VTAKADDRAKSAASSHPGESGINAAGDTQVAPSSMPPVQITGPDLLAPTLHASPTGAPADLLPGTILDGVYRVEKEIGRGAMGTVYLVEHLRLGRKFAAKVVSTKHVDNDEIGSRLRNEARVASRVQHENIVDVTHLGSTASGALFIVMELLSGSDLRELMQKQIDSGGPRWLPDAEIEALVSDVMAGLGAAHAAGIVHRDLKPDNIFVVEKSGRRRAKLVDFGISRSSESEDLGLTRDGQIIGTPLYMAPEQARGGPAVDARADLYSLGVLCHELLTGALPFRATSVYDMIVKHATEPPPPLRDVRPDLPVALERVLLKALAKKPDERFQTLDEMRDAWNAAWRSDAASVPVVSERSVPVALALPPPSPESRRGRLALVVVGLAAVVGLGLFALRSGSGALEEATPDAPPPVTHVEAPPVLEPIVPPTSEIVTAPDSPPAITERIVSSDPPSASVSIAGRDVGTTPCPIEVGAGPIEVELRLRGYRRERISIGNESSEPVSVTLHRAREAAPELAPR
jgi:serine/threonine protein kinase